MIPEPPRYACEGMLWFILFFAPAAFGSTEWWSRAVLESLIFILAAMCALRRDFFAPLNVPLIGFGVIIALGVLQLLQQRPLTGPAGFLPSTLSRPQTLYALLLWAAMAALLWSASGILRWDGAIRRLSWAIFLIGLFIAVVGILQRGQGNTAYYGLRPIRTGRPFGPFTNYDHAASWMVAAIFVGAGLFVEGFRRAGTPLTERVSRQTLIAFALIVQLAAVWETTSRGAINALFASALLTSYLSVGYLQRAMPRRLSRAGLILAACGYAAFLYFNPRWLGLADGVLDISAASRVSLYRSGLLMLSDFPIFGVGLGSFVNAFHSYQEPFVVGLVDHIHSSWFEIALETGFLGLVIFCPAVLTPLVALGRRLSASDFPERTTAIGFFGAFFSFALHGFVEYSFQIPANAILFVVIVAATLIPGLSSMKFASSTMRRPVAIPAGAFLVLALLSLAPGFAGAIPRLGAPFEPADFALLPSSAPDGPELIHDHEQLLLNPVDQRLRHRYGVALHKAGRFKDAQAYLFSSGEAR